jgi:protein-S-isoprenylcysteine O-methyltransferase Ste14
MQLTDWEAAAAVYLPLTAALILRLLNRNRAKQFAACLLSLLWVVPALLAVQAINLRTGWWTFSGDSVRFRGMPIECFAGWAILWGLVPQLALPRLGVCWLAALMVTTDLIAMPLCRPLVLLGPHWLIGEALAALVVLAPALLIAEWTMSGTHLRARAAFQAATSALLFLYFVPETAFALRPGAGWASFFLLPSWIGQVGIQVLLLLAVPGVSAVMEFATRGGGTPIPYDPPRRLVTSGIYRYCANPMQMSCAAVMLGWAGLLQNGWLALAAILSAIYGAGIAEWDEREDLARRFGNDWREYRAAVHNWRFRWKPYYSGPNATIYIAASCGPCSELRAWLEARGPVGLRIIDAEVLPPGAIRRVRYASADGNSDVEGIRAMGRALEHLNFGWAFAGFVLSLPGIWQVVQLLMDASGLGPRVVARRQGSESAPNWRQNSAEPDLDRQ